MDHDDIGLLPAFTLGTLILFYFVWAAMHDIAHGDEGTLEWTVLAICALAFAGLYWQAFRVLTSKAKLAWLIGTGFLLSLFDAGAISSMWHPKYVKDTMLASIFLLVGLPVLGLIGYHAVGEALHRRVRPES
jgi:peptidoglycan/LPS O-acetylase OafA/YrhL